MEDVIEKYTVEKGTEDVQPVIVLTGNYDEFFDFCSKTNRNKDTAIAIRQGFQIDLYPGLPIALYGNYGLNAAYDSQEYRQRTIQSAAEKLKGF